MIPVAFGLAFGRARQRCTSTSIDRIENRPRRALSVQIRLASRSQAVHRRRSYRWVGRRLRWVLQHGAIAA